MSSLGQWLRPSLTVPKTPWGAGESNWKAKPQTLLALVFGLACFGAGEAALVAADIGQSPWTVFADGIHHTFGISIGFSTFYISLVVLLLWIPLKRKPGLGTVLNIIIISAVLELMIPVFPHPTNPVAQVAEVLFGIALVGLGSGLYITSNLGAGPRDGLMTGLHEKTGIRISRVRLGIEVIVLIAGWLLGGKVGIGTVMFAMLIGQSVAIWFGVVGRIKHQDGHVN